MRLGVITKLRSYLCVLLISSFSIVCGQAIAKDISDFNFDWRFQLYENIYDTKQQAAYQHNYDDSNWSVVQVPHDWAVPLPYTDEKGAASSGFKAGGVGWYRKSFVLGKENQNKVVWLEFDGIYNNSDVWINGHHVAERPYGYSSFSAELTPYLLFDGQPNVVSVRVNRTSYADSRWYTGSGIYRNVRLVKADKIYIPQWGIQVSTPNIYDDLAKVKVQTTINAQAHQGQEAKLHIEIFDEQNQRVAQQTAYVDLAHQTNVVTEVEVRDPQLWALESPTLYHAKVSIYKNDGFFSSYKLIGDDKTRFGIRTIKFDANKGFLLNGKQTKIKGVNLHHDAGAVGVAVTKEMWRYRLNKLKSVGVNAIRMSHNPHSPELMELCDEMGFLVNAEIFDDWDRTKKKSKIRLGDNAVSGDAGRSYDEYFKQWAERDAKDAVRRDFNHPSVIMWSIGNEIEWTYPYYPKSATHAEDGTDYYTEAPDYTPERIRKNLKKHNPDSIDNLPIVSNMLRGFVKEIDTTRPVTAGLVQPSVGFTSGYTDTLDVVGFNYRAPEYEVAHKTNPDAIIYGSENWGAWREWRDVKDKDYVAGIFIWTGFAYKGESGPLPKMGLEISLFDFLGNKTPRGHFFETIWRSEPKIYLGTTAASQSEFSYSETDGWTFTARKYPKGVWAPIRNWEWYDIEEKWKYADGESIVVQSYTNTEEAELFLNGQSLGRKSLKAFDEDRVIKWLVPYQAGELKVVGYNQGKAVTEDMINTHGQLASIDLVADKPEMQADSYDAIQLHVTLLDAKGNRLFDDEQKVEFEVTGSFGQTFVDNGSEFNVGDVLADSVTSHKGRAGILIQSSTQAGDIRVVAKVGTVKSQPLILKVK
ncbi:glycoside hydrolase family 2 [Saccharobesus litoralis]|uniref:Glycoside hydrolase family 2 n=1 Tax=Saccharobesus litoralis TaxID=2172099 RepID=A0A2S0VT76_9ALTE|nr:glycoside hydrolase family 2 TIM barrel-domain containing protein [Saccharobesus litoralis]AWB67300.1 glycoside hydrolase family 2 [Saccharobesus litoralis]